MINWLNYVRTSFKLCTTSITWTNQSVKHVGTSSSAVAMDLKCRAAISVMQSLLYYNDFDRLTYCLCSLKEN